MTTGNIPRNTAGWKGILSKTDLFLTSASAANLVLPIRSLGAPAPSGGGTYSCPRGIFFRRWAAFLVADMAEKARLCVASNEPGRGIPPMVMRIRVVIVDG
eukprot:CAMPEP_0113570240 /NCGR_PEP_ID=MMETSP0015_2-20120614/24860_1 /TAXON_ID=2838 /ORGANISM="Odontella" /LENGTH=100 /DNA_ID=CAMNT_0000473001 /DNA_START=648 /DNA_END=950 /DNA_ORIENTATION=+ /assembly_acc=CAM_ASM_000160